MSMAFSNLAVSGLIIFILHQTPLVAAQPMPWQLCSYTSGNYTANSTYRENIQNLATILPDYASTSPSLFAVGKSGTIPDAIYALALCRGDTNASSCALCVAAAIRAAQDDLCALVKEVTIYDDPCILRFSNQDFPHNPLDNRGKFVAFDGNNVSAVVAPAFFAAVSRLVNVTAKFAAADQIRRFGMGEEVFDKTYPKIYALVQCTPDMTANDCWTCLMNMSSKFMPEYFYGKPGGRVFGMRCNFRFQTYSFLLRPAAGASPGPVCTTAFISSTA